MSLVSGTDTLPMGAFKPFRDFLASFLASAKKQPDIEEESRARRDFILDMMHEHPEAFQSELDIQNMMRICPSRF